MYLEAVDGFKSLINSLTTASLISLETIPEVLSIKPNPCLSKLLSTAHPECYLMHALSSIPTTHLPLHYPQKSFSESIVVFRLSTYKSIIDAGKCIISHEITILSNLVPDSSTILILHINAVSFSFCDFGVLSIIFLISTSGVPGLVISIRFSKFEITGPASVIEKS